MASHSFNYGAYLTVETEINNLKVDLEELRERIKELENKPEVLPAGPPDTITLELDESER
ncbi:hypothetical protein FACS189472_15600 [Alphaproteobacteria bacterium]|nr:hypothetical protein FACS189472_15600 [Alphaproteobacteria bacterium]